MLPSQEPSGLEPIDPREIDYNTAAPGWTFWHQVHSDFIGALRYNATEKKVQIAFTTNGTRYTVHEVEYRTYENWLNADSKGKFFHHAIKRFGYLITGPE